MLLENWDKVKTYIDVKLTGIKPSLESLFTLHKVKEVGNNIDNISTVAGMEDNINTVIVLKDDIETVVGNTTDISAVADALHVTIAPAIEFHGSAVGEDVTIPENMNAVSFGDITIKNGVTVTTKNNSTWRIR